MRASTLRLCLSLCCASSVAFYLPQAPVRPFCAPAAGRGALRSHAPPGSPPLAACPQSFGVGRRREGVRAGRMGGEMDDMSPEEGMIERLVEKLETSLDSAIKQEYFKDASTLRDELSRMHMDESSAVLKTNSDFYKAFSTKDIKLMGAVWLNNEQVQCIHPGAKPLVGYDNIISMWTNMFQAKDKVFRSTDIKPDHIKVHVRGTSAYVMCNEEVSAPGASRKMVATNIYRKYAGRWYMVHHHASQALRAAGGIEELLQGNTGASRVIRIDGNVRDGDGTPQDVMDEIVKAIQGALEGEEADLGKISDLEYRLANNDLVSGRMIDVDDDEDSDSDGEEGVGSEVSGGGGMFGDAFMSHERELMEGVTERTVEALRKLQKQGKISKEHKRRLLTDIINHHKAGESASSVEIAYELLVMRFLRPGMGVAAREEELLEEFGEQCTAIARRLE